MRILFLLNDIPYPHDTGIRNKVFNILSYISERHNCDIISLTYGNDFEDRLLAFCKQLPQINIIAIFPYESKIKFILRAILNLFSLTPIFVSRHFNYQLCLYLKKVLSKNKYDLIHYDTIGMAQYIKYSYNIPSILSVHDSPSMIYKSVAYTSSFLFKPIFLLYSLFISFYEQRIYKCFQKVHLVSEKDFQILPEKIKQSTSFVIIPMAVPSEIIFSNSKQIGYDNSLIILFSGNLKYKGIYEGFFEFFERFYPILKKMNIKLRVIGRMPYVIIKNKIPEDENIEYFEWVEDYQKMLDEAHICVFPDKFGTGIKTRVLYAMARGKAVVATHYALSGIKGENGYHFYMCENYKIMVEIIQNLIQNKALIEKVGNNARKLIISDYTAVSTGEKWESTYFIVSNGK